MLIVRSIRAPDAGFEGIHARNRVGCRPGGARTRMSAECRSRTWMSRTILVNQRMSLPARH